MKLGISSAAILAACVSARTSSPAPPAAAGVHASPRPGAPEAHAAAPVAATPPESRDAERRQAPAEIPLATPTRVDHTPSPRPAPPRPAKVRFAVRSSRRADPIRETPDPAPRALVTHRMILRLSREFERRAPATPEERSASEARWRRFVARGVPAPARPVVETIFGESGAALLAASESRWGAMRSVERFTMADGSSALLAAFRSATPTAPVSIFREHYRHVVALWQPRPDGEGFKIAWALDLDELTESVLEIDDLQIAGDGTLYANASYPSYAREVGGRTAYLYAIDPRESRVIWRTGPLVSRGEILIDGDVIVTGYGFTAEPDHLYAVDRLGGALIGRLRIPSAHDRLRKVGGTIHVRTYDADLVVEIVR